MIRAIGHLFGWHSYRCRGFASCLPVNKTARWDHPFKGWWHV